MRNYHNFLSKHETAYPSWNRLNVMLNEYRKYKKNKTKPLTILDIGCGRNAYLYKYISDEDTYFGCDYYKTTSTKLDRYIQIDLNEESLKEKINNTYFDVIFCGEVIEHLFSPDELLADIRKLLKKEGILILSTPNLSYYVNRFLLLVGISPLFLENSSEKKLGRKFKKLGQGNITEGHIRVFTYGALRELFHLKKYKIVRIIPVSVWGFWPDKFITFFSKGLAADNVFVVKK